MYKPKGHIVIVDDDAQLRALLEDYFRSEGYETTCFPVAPEALAALSGKGPTPLEPSHVDLVLSDIKMPQMTGTDFASKLKRVYPHIPVVLTTAFGSIESAIEAMRRGAYDYIVKPFKLAEVGVTVERAIEYRRLHGENQVLRKELKKSWHLDSLIGKSPAMQRVFDLVRRVSQARANVLITGESGTGKEMVARAIHENGPRKGAPFVAINCAAIPENLLESELFGHAKGSFTGASQRKIGLFEEGNGGTVFLDEIGDMDLALQAKLLRVMQDKSIRPVGDTQSRSVDVRVIAATNKDLPEEIKAGRFREDLYYRLSVIPFVIPPLRERVEDIPLLVEHFIEKYAAVNASPVRSCSQGTMKKLTGYHWPGNVRELENLIERIIVLSTNETITEAEIPELHQADPEQFFKSATSDLPTVEELEHRYIQLVLQKTGGRKDRAADILGINRRTLYRKEREMEAVAPCPSISENRVGQSQSI
ncbi:MAG: sigma-54-dependent Fis family transcriptional regulator [Bdellovibrionales bacterium]|nr:sigma-54-dependent Fis family transcriptional regulator [Bdellovibrionales bacterium]